MDFMGGGGGRVDTQLGGKQRGGAEKSWGRGAYDQTCYTKSSRELLKIQVKVSDKKK